MKIEALHLDFETQEETDSDLSAAEPQGFWIRQFQREPTNRQRIFDWAYGVIIPMICVAADPIVFRSDGLGSSLLVSYRPFAYVLSAVSILGMAAWLSWGPRLGILSAPLAGLFFVGSAISFLVGVVLSPFSLLGLLFYFVGFLGFTPLFSGMVFLRNGVQAYRAALRTVYDQPAWQAAFLAALFAFVTPYVVNVEVSGLVNEIVRGDVNTIRRESAKLAYVAPLVDPGLIAQGYFQSTTEERESPRMKELARVYRDLTGETIDRYWILD